MFTRSQQMKPKNSREFKKSFLSTLLPGCLALMVIGSMLMSPKATLANPRDENGNHSHGGGGGGGDGTGGKIAVAVTFLAIPAIPRFRSDGGFLYIDKVDKVSAYLGSANGNFIMGLGTKGNQPPIRTLLMDFSDCIGFPCMPPFQIGVNSGPMNFMTSGIDLRVMSVGETRDDLNLKIAIDLSNSGEGVWQLFFDPSDARCIGSSTITVTRMDADTWAIEAGLNDVACLAKQGGGGEFLFSGLYRMPFKVIVQRK